MHMSGFNFNDNNYLCNVVSWLLRSLLRIKLIDGQFFMRINSKKATFEKCGKNMYGNLNYIEFPSHQNIFLIL